MASKSKHTQGPYKVAVRCGKLIIVSSDQTVVARLDKWRKSAVEEMDANADLFAAAPELLEMLKEIFVEFLHYRPSQSDMLGGKRADEVEKKARLLLYRLK